MIDILAVIFGLILTFLVVVVVHELGHYFAARLVGVRSEKFSVGFGKTLWSRTARSGVRWQVAAVPLGGYVRFVGDGNAASLSTMPTGEIVPGSLKSVSKLRQAVVVIAGPLANVVLAALLLSAVPMISGVTSFPWTLDQVAASEAESGLHSGDRLLQVEELVIDPNTAPAAVLAAQGNKATISYRFLRDGKEIEANGPRLDFPMIGLVNPGSPAANAGLAVGDLITEIDGTAVDRWGHLQAAVSASEGNALDLTLQRGSETLTASLSPELRGGRWLIGVGSAPYYTLAQETPSVFRAIGIGVEQTGMRLRHIAGGLAMSLFGAGDPCALDGPVAIARVAGQAVQLGPVVLLTFMAVISLGLGLLNMLPIPILDGGHLAMLGFEGATGRPVGKRLQAVLFIGGVTLIVFLMLTATINDLRC